MQVESVEMASALTRIVVETRTTVADLLGKLKIKSGKYLAILVDGKKAELNQEIGEGQNVVILPMIAGG